MLFDAVAAALIMVVLSRLGPVCRALILLAGTLLCLAFIAIVLLAIGSVDPAMAVWAGVFTVGLCVAGLLLLPR